MQEFILHPRLSDDTAFVADLPLSRVLLMNDARYPWLILVPRRGGATEVFDLERSDGAAVMEEVSRAARDLKEISGAAKINVGALGNLVPQLHVHVVARRPGDAAWPGPVWGQGTATPYDAVERDALIGRLRARFQSEAPVAPAGISRGLVMRRGAPSPSAPACCRRGRRRTEASTRAFACAAGFRHCR